MAWKAGKEKGLNSLLQSVVELMRCHTRPYRGNQAVLHSGCSVLASSMSHYDRKMAPRWAERVKQVSNERVTESQGWYYKADGQQKALAPAGWVLL